jgi:hypothetical protein
MALFWSLPPSGADAPASRPWACHALLVARPDVLDGELHQVSTDLGHPHSLHLGHALGAALEDVTEGEYKCSPRCLLLSVVGPLACTSRRSSPPHRRQFVQRQAHHDRSCSLTSLKPPAGHHALNAKASHHSPHPPPPQLVVLLLEPPISAPSHPGWLRWELETASATRMHVVHKSRTPASLVRFSDGSARRNHV